MFTLLIIVCRTLVSIVITFWVVNSRLMDKHLLIKFGQKVRQERTKLGLSQEKLAEIANVHRTYVGMIERAEKNITLTNVDKIAKALGLSIEELMKGL